MNAVLIDMVRLWDRPADAIVAIQRQIPNSERLIVVCSSEHEEVIRGAIEGSAELVPLRSPDPNRVVGLATEALTGVTDTVVLYSLDPVALKVASQNARIYTKQLVQLLPAGLRSAASSPGDRDWNDAFMPRAKAVSDLVDSLQGSNTRDTGVHMTSLRAALTTHNGAWRKVDGTLSAAPGLMKALVSLGKRDGRVMVDDDEHNPVVWLAPSDMVPEMGLTGNGLSRSQLFIDTLRSRELGPFGDVRAEVLVQLSRIISAGPTPLVGGISQAVDAVRLNPPARLKCDPEKYSWRAVRVFFEKVICDAGLALDENGAEVRPGLRNRRVAVHSIKENAVEVVDGYLMLALVDGGMSLTYHDLRDLAGALYLHPSEAHVDAVAEALAALVERGLLIEGDPPKLSLSRPGVA